MRPARIAPRILAAMLTLSAAACAADPTTCRFTSRTDVRLTTTGRLAAVPALVNGQSLSLVLDTGAVVSFLKPEAAGRAGMSSDTQRSAHLIGLAGPAQYPVGAPDSFVLGGQPETVTRLPVIDGGTPLDGNLGMDILGRTDIDLDLPAHRMTLYRGRLCSGQTPPWATASTEIDVKAIGTPGGFEVHRLLAEVSLDGHKTYALLDTGATRTLVSERVAARLGIDRRQLDEARALQMKTVSRDVVATRPWRFHELAFGTERIDAPRLVVAPVADTLPDIIIGMDILSRYRIWISYSGRRMLLARQPSP